MNSFKLRIIFIIIGIVYILFVPAVFAIEQDMMDTAIAEGIVSSEDISTEEINSDGIESMTTVDHSSEEIENLTPIGQKGESGVENTKMKIYVFEGKEMLQLRDLAEEFGWSLHYNTTEKEIIIRNSNQLYILKTGPGSSPENIDSLDPFISDGRTYLSTSLLSKILKEVGEERIITGLYTDKTQYNEGEKIQAHIRLFNLTAAAIKLNFGSGQRYDLYLSQGGQEIWRWSDGRFFTMALVQKELQAGQSLEYDLELELTDLKAGKYILAGELATIPERMDLDEVLIRIRD